jgi:23S rRNA pseudouridine1911/1915/1917 synthase
MTDDQPPGVAHPTGTTSLIVLPSEAGARLDKFLAATTTLSRRAARRLVDDGSVLLNQRPTRVQSRTVEAGDVVDVLRPSSELEPREPPRIPSPRILHEDRWLVVADKPAGVLSQPAERQGRSELAFDQIMLIDLARRHGKRPFLRLVHRLDRITSGAFLCALAPQALPPLTRAWSEGEVDRRYLAVVEGHPSSDAIEIDRPIARDPDHDWRFRVSDTGQPSRTVIRVLDRGPDELAVLDCRLITGRTHQVRVHLAAIGHPVVGDRLYGSRRPSLAPRPLLHAVALALPHPKSGQRLLVVCPTPEDMSALVSQDLEGTFLQALESRSHTR